MFKLLTILIATGSIHGTPAWEADLTSPTPGSHPSISSCTAVYSLSWKGMLKAGELDLRFANAGATKPGSFVAQSNARSLGAAAAIYPYSHSYWSETDPKSLLPKYFRSTERDSEETTITTNRYTRTKVDSEEVSTDLKSGKSKSRLLAFPYGPGRDVFSAYLHLRSQPLAVGEEHVMLVVPFKSPYLLRVRCEGREPHLGVSTIRLSFSMRKIDTKTHELKPYKKLKKPVTVWISDDQERIPIEIRASAFIGDVRAVLTSYKKTP